MQVNPLAFQSQSQGADVVGLPSQDLGQTFRDLWINQLKYQNPLEPVSSEQMVSQLAEINSVNAQQAIREQTEQLGRSVEHLAKMVSAGMINRKVELDTGEVMVGTAGARESVVTINGHQGQPIYAHLYDSAGELIKETEYLMKKERQVDLYALFGELPEGRYQLKVNTDSGSPLQTTVVGLVDSISYLKKSNDFLIALRGGGGARVSSLSAILSD